VDQVRQAGGLIIQGGTKMEKLLMTVVFCVSVSLVGYLLWLMRSPSKTDYENSECNMIKEVVETYEPRQKRK